MGAELSVPTTLCGITLAEPLTLNRKVDGTIIWIIDGIRAITMQMICYTMQAVFVWELWQIDEQNKDCSMKYRALEMVCLIVFQTVVFQEAVHGGEICLLLWTAPSDGSLNLEEMTLSQYSPVFWDGQQQNQRDPRRMMMACDPTGITSCVQDRGKLDVMEERVRMMEQRANEAAAGGQGAILADESSVSAKLRKARKLPPPGVKQWTLEGMSTLYKIWMFFFLGIGKLLMAILVSYTGGYYIINTESKEDTILNTLGVTFVVEIGDYLYAAFTPAAMKDQLEHMKPVEMELNNMGRIFFWALHAFVFPASVLGWCLILEQMAWMAHCEGDEL